MNTDGSALQSSRADTAETTFGGSCSPIARSARYPRCIVIGGGAVQSRGGRLFTKRAVAQYLRELSESFAELWFVAVLTRTPQQYTSCIDPSWANVIAWDPSALALSVRAAARVCRLADSSSAVLLQMPNVYALPLIPVLAARAGRFIVYAAGDWVEFAKELRSRGQGWRAPIDTAAVTLALRLSDVALVRGPKLAAQAAPFAKSVVLSEAIIDGGQSWTQRTDTCTADKICILFVGKLLRSKGLDVLLRGIQHLKTTAPHVATRLRLEIVGAGDHEIFMRQIVKELSLEHQVHFRGFMDDSEALSSAYAQADMLIVPSAESEGLPRVLEEGLRHQLPIVASAVGGIPFAYRHGEDLLLVRPSDETGLADAMLELITDPALRQRLIQNARRRGHSERPLTAARQHVSILMGQSV
jgi:glycosyltransferase involved in cell wall biosynthesis